jgi:hypothetical protein
MPRPILTGISVTGQDRIRAVVRDTGGSSLARVEEVVVQAGGAAPATGSRIWSLVGSVTAGEAVLTGQRQPHQRTWLRASGRSSSGQRTGLYSDPVPVQVPPRPRLGDVRLQIDEAGAVVLWRGRGSTETVRVRWDVHAEGADPVLGDPVDVAVELGLYSIPDRPALGEVVTVRLEPIDDARIYLLDGTAVTDQEGEPLLREEPTIGGATTPTRQRPMDLGTVEEPKHWMFTEGAVPVRGTDFRLLVSAGLDVPDDWFLLQDGRPVRFNDLTVARSVT